MNNKAIIIIFAMFMLLIWIPVIVYRSVKYKNRLARRVRNKFLKVSKELGEPLTLGGKKYELGSLSFFLRKPLKILREADFWDEKRIVKELSCDYIWYTVKECSWQDVCYC